jgi:hypothetical protein
VRAVGIRPWWLYVPKDRWQRQYDVRKPSRAVGAISCVLALAALLAALAAGIARRRRDVASGALIGFMLCGALFAVAASTPAPRHLALTLGYTMWQGSQVGMWVWLILAWSAWLAWPHLLARLPARRHAPAGEGWRARLGVALAMLSVLGGRRGTIALALSATLAVAAAVTTTQRPDEHRAVYRATASLAASVERAVPSGHSVELLSNLGYSTMVIKPAIRFVLARHGVRALGSYAGGRIGDWYELRDRPFQYVVYVGDGVRTPVVGAHMIDRVSLRDEHGRHVVSLWIAPHPATTARPLVGARLRHA